MSKRLNRSDLVTLLVSMTVCFVLVALGFSYLVAAPMAVAVTMINGAAWRGDQRMRAARPLSMIEEAHKAALADMAADKAKQAACRHDHVEDVDAGGERVARLCTDCWLQLPADFLTPAERPTPVVTAFSGGGGGSSGGSGGSTTTYITSPGGTAAVPPNEWLEASEQLMDAGNSTADVSRAMNDVIRSVTGKLQVSHDMKGGMWRQSYTPDGILLSVECRTCNTVVWQRMRVGPVLTHAQGCPSYGKLPRG